MFFINSKHNIHLFNKYLPRTYFVQGNVHGTRGTSMKKIKTEKKNEITVPTEFIL